MFESRQGLIFLMKHSNIILAKKSDYDSKWVGESPECQLRAFSIFYESH